jgi:hypothetical protein
MHFEIGVKFKLIEEFTMLLPKGPTTFEKILSAQYFVK